MKNRDLTQGAPGRVLLRFCLPLFGSILFQQMYNLADSFVVGRYVGKNALAAVGNSYEITLVFLAVAFGVNIGCSVVVSQLFGAKKYGDMKTAVTTTGIAGAALCAVMMGAGFLFSPGLLRWIQTPQEIFADSLVYLNIYIAGLAFLFFYNIATGIFSAMGDSKTPFLFLSVSSVANVGFDVLFVRAFGMGVSGVAWATFLCQGVSCVCAMGALYKRLKGIETDEKHVPFSWAVFGRICVIAVPSIFQQSFISVGNIVIQSIINGFGSSVIAGYAAAIKLNNLVITSFTTLGNGVSNFTAQNIGAGEIQRVKHGFKSGLGMIFALSAGITALYLLTPDALVGVFMNGQAADALNSGVQFLRVVAPFYLVVAVKLIADGVLRGAGAMKHFMIATFTDLVLRVALAWALSVWLGSIGIWLAWPVGWLIGAAMSTVFYARGVWLPKDKIQQ